MRAFEQVATESEHSSPRDRVSLCPPLQFASPSRAETATPLIYDLRRDARNSDRFFADVAAFSARVVAEVESRASSALNAYSRFVSAVLREPPRSRAEYALEWLTVGMILRLYGETAARTPVWVVDLARELYAVRRRNARIKPFADFLRGCLFQLFMRRPRRGLDAENASGRPTQNSLAQWLPLIAWLQATGEFDQEWKRINNWLAWWRTLPGSLVENQLATALALFDWFTLEADRALGPYTAGVEPFLETAYASRFAREDQIFCGRLPVEYHLGMVAAEVMNAGLRADFQTRPRKVLLVPTCLRGAKSAQCRARTSGLDITCAGCDPDCGVYRITRRMAREGIDVYMIPHASGFSRWLERWQHDSRVGVAAVACMMNILSGGYEMRARGIASQCVPLDYPGCDRHWAHPAIPTAVNEDRLVQIVSRSSN